MTDITIPRYMVEDALSASGSWSYSIREKYSGRYMYGNTCFGVVLAALYKDSFLKALRACIADDEGIDDEAESDMDDEEYKELLAARKKADSVVRRATTDDMGLDMIVYFPGVTLEG